MKAIKSKYLILLLFCFSISFVYSQSNTRKVLFEILDGENNPLPGATILVKNSNPIISTNTNFDGKAQLDLTELEVSVELRVLGPHIKFDLMKNIDFVKVDLKKKKILYYYENKIVKKKKLKMKGY